MQKQKQNKTAPTVPLPAICLFHFHGNAKQNKWLCLSFMKVGQTTADKQEGEL